LHIRAHLRWVPRWTRRLLVGAGVWYPLTKPAVAELLIQATTEPHGSRGAQRSFAEFAHARCSAGRGLPPRRPGLEPALGPLFNKRSSFQSVNKLLTELGGVLRYNPTPDCYCFFYKPTKPLD
jgi:hypothetical protein